jgi:hypothetical protein
MGNAKARTWPEVAVAGAYVTDDKKIVYKIGELDSEASKDLREMLVQEMVVKRRAIIDAMAIPKEFLDGADKYRSVGDSLEILKSLTQGTMANIERRMNVQDVVTLNTVATNGSISYAQTYPRRKLEMGLAEIWSWLCRRYLKTNFGTAVTTKIFCTGVIANGFPMYRDDSLIAQMLCDGAVLPWRLIDDTVAALDSMASEVDLHADNMTAAGPLLRLYAHFLRTVYVRYEGRDDKPIAVCWQHEGDPNYPETRRWPLGFNVFIDMLSHNFFWVRDPPDADPFNINFVSRE